MAKREKKPTAQVIRELVAVGLRKKALPMNAGKRLLHMAGKAVPGAEPDGSLRIDEELYNT